jgi:hypothetical protein
MTERDALDEIYELATDIDASILLDFHGIKSTWKERLDEMREKLKRILELSGHDA